MLAVRITKTFRRNSCHFSLDVDFSIGPEFSRAVFFGPSGSGKTLTMQCIAGLVNPDKGRIRVNKTTFYDSSAKLSLPARLRHVGYLFQDYALFPHLTLLQNVAYARTGLFARKVNARETQRARKMLDRFGLGSLETLYPSELSGGQKQRAAMARALNASPNLLLLDEPFSALDQLLREHMRREIRDFLHELPIPAIIITHDPQDVDAFAGALVIYNHGHAMVVPSWQAERAKFATTAACLRHLQEKSA